FVAGAVRGAVRTRELRNRAGPALHAAVALDAVKRARVEQLLVNRLQDPKLEGGQRADVALVAAALGDLTPVTATRVAEAFTQAMIKATDLPALRSLAEGLSVVAAQVEAKDAAQFAAALTQAMTKTTNAPALCFLAQGLSAVAARMEPDDAARVCAQAATTLTQAMTNTTASQALSFLVDGLSAVAARVVTPDAAQAAATLIEAM